MRPNDLRSKSENGLPLVNAWLSIPSAYAAEVVVAQGFDSVTVDLQHGMMDFAQAVAMLQAISTTQAVPLVRSSSAEPSHLMRLLDAGAYGVICPQVDTPEIARQFVAACRYPPMGNRSFGPARGLLYGGPDYFDHANHTVLTLAMIESVEGMRNMESIMETDGLDGIYVGPNDLALSLGERPGASFAPRVEEAIAVILEAARKRNLMTGIFCADGDSAQARLQQGFSLVTPGNDVGSLGSELRRRLERSRGGRSLSGHALQPAAREGGGAGGY